MGITHLISGSDLRGVAVDIGKGVTLDAGIARQAAYAFAQFLSNKLGKPSPRICVGLDPRLSGPALCKGVLEGLAAFGAQALTCGLCTTPAMFMTTVDADCDGAVMITASHLPFERNGLKFMTRQGGLETSEVKAIASAAHPAPETPPNAQPLDYLPRYAAGLVQYVHNACGAERPLAGRRILVDAGNGSGGFFARQVLEPLGVDTQGSLYLEPDGHFPHHIPNPEDAGAMAGLCQAVMERRADLGVMFDADCDRAALVDHRGEPIHRNRLIAMLAAIVLRAHPGCTLVTDSVTSSGLTRFIERLGGKHVRFKRGYKNVIGEAQRLNEVGVDCPLAVETSGHCAFRDNYFLDDGAYLAARLLVELARLGSLTQLIEDLEEPAEEKEVRLPITAADFRTAGQDVVDAVRKAIASHPDWSPNQDYEGVRVTVRLPKGEGFFLVRLSVHDPVLAVNLESDVTGGVVQMARQLAAALQGLPGVDWTALSSM